MNYKETLDYLYHRLPMFSRVGTSALKNNLHNITALCNVLDNPQRKFKSVHVAGTNGKGSTSHMLAAVLQQSGYRTGMHTSPHLKDFRERIKVNGAMCDEGFVVQFTEKIKPLIEELKPSFFEISVAMAFEYFAQQKVDIAVIEVGLGGRLDSTNIIQPVLSVITNISYDHVHILGDTLEKIAFEKAGIIKNETPVVIGEVLPETVSVFESMAESKNAPLIFADKDFFVSEWEYLHHNLVVTIVNAKNDNHLKYSIDLPGTYQLKNIITVISALHQLRLLGWSLHDDDIYIGLANAKKITGLHGRWEVIHQKPLVILDVCHNVDGITQMVQQLEHCTYNHLHIVFGMVKDKDINAVLKLLPNTATYYFTRAQIERAMPENELAEKANACGLHGKYYHNVHIALDEAKKHANEKDMILVCGSVFLVAEV